MNADLNTALLPSPPEGEGLGERGKPRITSWVSYATFPLSLTLSRKGRGDNLTEPFHG